MAEQINYTSPENQLREALENYFYVRLGGTKEDFSNWFAAIAKETDGWKMMRKNKQETDKINNEYDLPEWFMWAVQATV